MAKSIGWPLFSYTYYCVCVCRQSSSEPLELIAFFPEHLLIIRNKIFMAKTASLLAVSLNFDYQWMSVWRVPGVGKDAVGSSVHITLSYPFADLQPCISIHICNSPFPPDHVIPYANECGLNCIFGPRIFFLCLLVGVLFSFCSDWFVCLCCA